MNSMIEYVEKQMIDDHMEISAYFLILSFIYNILFNYNRYFEK